VVGSAQHQQYLEGKESARDKQTQVQETKRLAPSIGWGFFHYAREFGMPWSASIGHAGLGGVARAGILQVTSAWVVYWLALLWRRQCSVACGFRLAASANKSIVVPSFLMVTTTRLHLNINRNSQEIMALGAVQTNKYRRETQR
jgi:hypothetical protein